MVIIPLGSEDHALQRRPLVTYALIAINVACFLLLCLSATDQERSELILSWRSTISYLRERPYLKVPAVAAELMPSDLRTRVPRRDPSVAEWRLWKEQDVADGKAAELRRLHGQVPDVSLAYVPAVGAPETIFTSMFLHAGVAHLVLNMLFLLAVGPLLEDAYGRVLYLLLYVSGGVAATLAFAARHPRLITPLVGASGAIAAVMGAYLVRFALARLQFLVIPLLFLPMWNFRFGARALVVLPIWLLEQVVSIPMEGDSGVAVTAHVGGFVYGFAFALVVKGVRTVAAPRPAAAKPIAQAPDPAELRHALDVALFQESPDAVDQAAAKLLAAFGAARDPSAARQLILELVPYFENQRMRRFLPQAAAFAERSGDRPLAISLYERFCEVEAAAPEVIPSLVRLASLRQSKGDVRGAEDALSRARSHPECSVEWQRRIDNTLAIMSGG
jgi:membrane associated rhomboid family serine protease